MCTQRAEQRKGEINVVFKTFKDVLSQESVSFPLWKGYWSCSDDSVEKVTCSPTTRLMMSNLQGPHKRLVLAISVPVCCLFTVHCLLQVNSCQKEKAKADTADTRCSSLTSARAHTRAPTHSHGYTPHHTSRHAHAQSYLRRVWKSLVFYSP